MLFVDPPIKVAPLLDESPTSWITRICLKYHISLQNLISIYELKDLMKEPVNITADLNPLSIFLPEGESLPNTINSKIASFEWKKGRSDWLIYPNKKGSVFHNSFTRICPKCLREKGYYQLKWMLGIVNFCAEHSIELIEQCPKCKSSITSIIKSSYSKRIIFHENTTRCKKCNYQLTRMKPRERSDSKEINENLKIVKAYSENPSNLRFLEHILNS